MGALFFFGWGEGRRGGEVRGREGGNGRCAWPPDSELKLCLRFLSVQKIHVPRGCISEDAEIQDGSRDLAVIGFGDRWGHEDIVSCACVCEEWHNSLRL